MARALRDAGHEVIYTGLHQTPKQIARVAADEDVDAVGLSSLSGAHMSLFPDVVAELGHQMGTDIPVFAGGVIPERDISTLLERGVRAVFTTGTHLSEITNWVADLDSTPRDSDLETHTT